MGLREGNIQAGRGSSAAPQVKTVKKLHIEHLRSRRSFLKKALRKGVTPAVVVYSIHKTLPPLFGRSGP